MQLLYLQKVVEEAKEALDSRLDTSKTFVSRWSVCVSVFVGI